MLLKQPSRLWSLSSGLLNLSYFLTLTFPAWGALVITMYMLLEHGTFSLNFLRPESD
jgi:hypothetical protein